MWLFLSSQEEDMPEEVNIDELLDLQSDEERTQKLKVSAFLNYWWRNQYVVGLSLTSLKEQFTQKVNHMNYFYEQFLLLNFFICFPHKIEIHRDLEQII